MDEIVDSINKKTRILLARNTPVALVVGAAGFLGSHLVDGLLSKGIQVIGVDNLQDGGKDNLQEAIGNKNFHFLIDSAKDTDFELPRLDYLFIVSGGNFDLAKIVEVLKKNKCRGLLVSSIDLYDKENDHQDLKWFKEAEAKIAKSAKENNLNARIVRLGPVFGPRMHFKTKDPLIRLIHQALSGDLQQDVSLEFSSRALYIDDAIDLLIKAIFTGSTAHKIFDGVASAPIKISEVKQVLLDPVWYDQKGFNPQELPPWPTPNLEKTMKFLHWYPRQRLVANLKETLSYFKDNEIHPPKIDIRQEEEKQKWTEEKKEALEGLRPSDKKPPEKQKGNKKGIALAKFHMSLSKIYLLFAVLLIMYALVWPVLALGWGVLTFRHQLSEAVLNLEKGEFDKSLKNVKEANSAVSQAKAIYNSFAVLRKTGVLKKEFELGDDLANLSTLAATSAQATLLGVQDLFQSLKAVTGEISDSPENYLASAQIQLGEADESLSKAYALSSSEDFNKRVPKILKGRIESLTEKLTTYTNLVKKARALSVLLPSVIAMNGSKNYLILLQNNMELRPAGGFIGSFAKVNFEGGKLKKLEVNDIYAIDGQLQINVEPPKEIKEDLNQKDWFLRDSNWEPDFPSSARQAEWFYTKETGERVEGVVALDISAMEDLLSVVGSLDLSDYNEKITSENLFERAIIHAEISFFPGSQAKKSFLTALTNQLFNKIFFLPKQNWPGIVASLGRSLERKHMSIYLDDPKLFSYLVSQNWTHVLPRASSQNQSQDFLALVEANLGANKANYYLDRNYHLETAIGKEGEIRHRLRLSYTNRSPSDVFPGGKYKNRMRVYLPFGSKLTRVLWAEADITKGVTSFVDYGRSGYSFLLTLEPKQQKNLVIDYQIPQKLEFKDGKASYRLDIVKQAGTLKDPLEWRITYPLSYQLISNQTQKINPQEHTISTDLSVDRSFEIIFKK